MRKAPAPAMNGGYHRMVGRAGFDGTVCFPVAHLSDTDNVRVETECRHKQLCLRDVICLVIRRAGDGMHHIVDNLPCSVPLDKRQFPCARFDGIDTLIVRNSGKQSIEQCGFTGGGSTRNDKGHAVSDAGFKETEHFLRQCICADEIVPVHSLRVQFTDTDSNRAFFIDHGLFHRRNTGIVRQMSLC